MMVFEAGCIGQERLTIDGSMIFEPRLAPERLRAVRPCLTHKEQTRFVLDAELIHQRLQLFGLAGELGRGLGALACRLVALAGDGGDL